jgi:Protein of unknown function (DUF1761)
MNDQKINYVAVLVAGVASFVLGAVWYTALSEPWMVAQGLTDAQIQADEGGASQFIVSFLSYIAVAYTLSIVFKSMTINTWQKGLQTGALFGFIFVFMQTMVNNMYGMKGFDLTLINGGFGTLMCSLAGAIVGGWQKK